MEAWHKRTKYMPLEAACIFWSLCTMKVLHQHGIKSLIQAGSASWRRLREDQDDGKETTCTHFSYIFEADKAIMKMVQGELPEMHIWVGVKPNTIIDMTTKYFPLQCQKLIGQDWPGDKPPDYLWANKLPPDAVYEADPTACQMAVHFAHNLLTNGTDLP